MTVKAVFWPFTVTPSDLAREATGPPSKCRRHDSDLIFAPFAPVLGPLWGTFGGARLLFLLVLLLLLFLLLCARDSICHNFTIFNMTLLLRHGQHYMCKDY